MNTKSVLNSFFEKKKLYEDYLLSVYEDFNTTEEVAVPKDPMLHVIGQDRAVERALISSIQRRHLLLAGPPGTGKSMIARAIAEYLPNPKEQIAIYHNPQRPERPILRIEHSEKEGEEVSPRFRIVGIREVPVSVAEDLGYRCRRCGEISSYLQEVCPFCGADKYLLGDRNPLDDLLFEPLRQKKFRKKRVCRYEFPNGEVRYYEVNDSKTIKEYDERSYQLKVKYRFPLKKVLVPLKRNTFVEATGASVSELLGDVQHDPYGGHPDIGVPPHLRVVPGAVHEAHEGVLYIDELASLSLELQKSLLTAMQEKKYTIAGRNATSTGATIRVENVPCDFILVASINFWDLQHIIPPLRSRILGNGYEVVIETYMNDSKENRAKLLQFVAQEVKKDGKIPHFSRGAFEEVVKAARNIAKHVDKAPNALTLRLRKLSGVVKLSGDLAVLEGAEIVEKTHVKEAVEKAKTIEEQMVDKYGNMYSASLSEVSTPGKPSYMG